MRTAAAATAWSSRAAGANCIADAAADFDGHRGKWQSLEVPRRSSRSVVGRDDRDGRWRSSARIRRTRSRPARHNRAALPARIFRVRCSSRPPARPIRPIRRSHTQSTTNQVIKLSFACASRPAPTEQPVRLYRNAREDSLFTRRDGGHDRRDVDHGRRAQGRSLLPRDRADRVRRRRRSACSSSSTRSA